MLKSIEDMLGSWSRMREVHISLIEKCSNLQKARLMVRLECVGCKCEGAGCTSHMSLSIPTGV